MTLPSQFNLAKMASKLLTRLAEPRHSCPQCEDGPEVELIKQFRVFPEGGEPANDYPSDRYRR
jgi:hypothetical protein